jgi:hypothetical protein
MKSNKKNRKSVDFGLNNSIIHTNITPLFGISLNAESIEERACVFVETCIEFLQSKGLENLQGVFRLCGSKTDIENLRDQANQDIMQFAIPEEQEPHSVAGVLKQYLRELPDPLVPFELYGDFISAASINRTECCPEEIMKCLALLPSTQRYLLGKLCKFLNEVQTHRASNLMSSENLATCIGPNLLRTADNDLKTMISDTPAIMSLFTILIKDATEYFQDSDSFRPIVRKRGKRLSELNKQMFTIHLSSTEKKSILFNHEDSLHFVLEKICIARGISMDTLTVLDGNHNTISIYKSLSEVEGRCVHLCYPNLNEIPKTKPPELPKIRHPDPNEFIFPLPNSPIVLDLQKAFVDIHEAKQSNRKSIGKSLSTSLIPRALTPRSEKSDLSSSAEGPMPLSSRSASDNTPYFNVKEDKRKSWKNQLMTKRASEINTKSLNQGKRTKSDIQVPPIQNRAPLISQSTKAKSELQVPSIQSNIIPSSELLSQRTFFDSKKGRAHATKSAVRGKENTPA